MRRPAIPAFFPLVLICFVFAVAGCSPCTGVVTSSHTSVGVTVTPSDAYAAYYSTPKARHLAEHYSRDLEDLQKQAAQHLGGQSPFASDIISVSVGFFTHTANQPPDQRYLEVMVDMPDILEKDRDFRAKIDHLFTHYGPTLLAILCGNANIDKEDQVAGYGLNFSWRSLAPTPSSSRLSLERAVIYIPKAETRKFVNQQMNQQELLASATIFIHGERSSGLLPYPAPQRQVSAPQTTSTKRETVAATMPILGKDSATEQRIKRALEPWLLRNSRPTHICSTVACS